MNKKKWFYSLDGDLIFNGFRCSKSSEMSHDIGERGPFDTFQMAKRDLIKEMDFYLTNLKLQKKRIRKTLKREVGDEYEF